MDLEAGTLAWALAALYALALFNIVDVLKHYRTTQGALGWIIALISFPGVTLLLYWLFGRNRFEGYVAARRYGDRTLAPLADELAANAGPWVTPPGPNCEELQAISRLVRLPFTRGNACELLIDGARTYASMFEAIRSARHYVLVEFYIIRDDDIGRRLADLLLERLQAGVAVYLLYDAIGSALLSRRYIRRLSRAGAKVHAFNRASRRPKRLQMNFRNHRKIVIVDGRWGFLGGLNIGREYLGLDPALTPWRDTHLRVSGPCVQALQLIFVEDWFWSADSVPSLHWQPEPDQGTASVMILPWSAADPFETGTLFFLNAINHARHRLWIASPYFVPDQDILNALQLAALRGVDVRILTAGRQDSWVVYLASHTFLETCQHIGIRVYRYRQGFMHQKALLVDDRYAAVGTANLDNRSLRLNFEVTAVVSDPAFVEQVGQMMRRDLEASDPTGAADFRGRHAAFQLLCRGARLLSPLL